MKLTRFIFAFLIVSLFSIQIVRATPGEWSTDGTNLYYTDGRVGIGNSTPSALLDVGSHPSGITSGHLVVDDVNRKVYVGRLGDSGNTKNFIVQNRVGAEIFNVDVNNGQIFSNSRLKITSGNEVLQLSNGERSMTINRAPGGANTGSWVFNTHDNFEFVTDGIARVKIDNTALYAREIRVNSTWADYVFEPEYKLMNLYDLEKFIKENKHLPNIPSAKTIENEDLNVGETMRLQMEKIEELTLHTIEQQKQIDYLKSKIK